MSGILAPSLPSRRLLWLFEWRSAEPAAMMFLVPRVYLPYNNNINNDYHIIRSVFGGMSAPSGYVSLSRDGLHYAFFFIIQIIVVSKGNN